jgi:hypothetical protein
MDNLIKSGKFYAGGPRPMGAMRPGADFGKHYLNLAVENENRGLMASRAQIA